MTTYQWELLSFSNDSDFSLFKGNFFVLAVIGTHTFNSFQKLLLSQSFQLLNHQISNIFYYREFGLIFRSLIVPIDPLINLSNIFIFPFNITLAPTHNFNSPGKFPVWDRLMLSGIAMEHVFVSVSFLLSWALKATISEASLWIELSFSLPAKELFR